jgi:2-methylcitrate dehydratase PrpD
MERVYNNQSRLTLSQRLACYLHDARFEDIDAVTRKRAKEVIAYHVSLAFRALHEGLVEGHQALAAARLLSGGCGRSTLIGQSDKVTQVDAVLANCSLMRAGGLDDVILPVGIHAGLMTLPPAFAVGELQTSTGAELVTAIVLGYEIMGKFGSFTWTEETPRRPTMPYGPFGGIAVCGRLLRLTGEQFAHALGYAAHTAMGLAESDTGQVTHHYGLICRNSLTGACLAALGGVASPTVLEGRFGFLEAFCPNTSIDVEKLMASFGQDHVIVESVEKRYPGTALNLVPIEAMRDMVAAKLFTADDIVSVRVSVPIERQKIAVLHSTGPFDNTQAPTSAAAFQMAMLVVDGELKLARYADFNNPEIMAVVRKTSFEFVAGRPLRYAKVEVLTKDGSRHVRESTHFTFRPQDAYTIIERYAARFLPACQIRRFVDLLGDLEKVSDVSQLTACLAPPPLTVTSATRQPP